MVRPYTRDVLTGNPHLNAVVTDDPEGRHAGRSGFWSQVRMLRSHRFDTALLLLPTERLAWMLFAAGIRTRVGVGLKLYEALTFMRTVSRHKYIPLRHEADYCLDLGRAIGVRSDDLSTEVFLSSEERLRGRDLLRSRGIPLDGGSATPSVVLMHPGSGRSSPNWRIEHYATLARELVADDRTWVVVTGGAAERPFSGHFGSIGSGHVVDLIGALTLRELMSVIAASSMLVSASTGPMHLAAALRIPTVSMFCPLTACSPALWGPRGNRSETILPPAEYCRTRCPGDPHVCQFEEGIFPAEVASRVRFVLGDTGTRGKT